MSGISRTWTIVVLGSLAVNFFIAGVLISSWAFGGPGNPIDRFNSERFRNQTQSDRMVRQITEHHGANIRPSIQAVTEARRAVSAALAADPFDEQALVDAFDALLTSTLESQAAMHDVMVESVRAMTPAQRRELAAESKRRAGRLLGR
jgi:Spy/CpxP family protein refolding chaperone